MYPDQEWIMEYMDVLFTVDPEKTNIYHSHVIKNRHIPAVVYKYRSLSDSSLQYTLDSISKQEIWLAKPSSFNDPYDSALYMDTSKLDKLILRNNFEKYPKFDELNAKHPDVVQKILNGEELLEAFSKPLRDELPDDKFREFVTILKTFIEKQSQKRIEEFSSFQQDALRICCVSSTANNMLLWSHYADNHRGICIEYNMDSLPANSPQRLSLFPVIYSDNFPDITKFLTHDHEKHNIFYPTYCAMHKASCWSYEQEWRFILQLGGEESGIRWPLPISAIYLGAKTQDRYIEAIKDIVKPMDIAIYRMQASQNSFSITAELMDKQ